MEEKEKKMKVMCKRRSRRMRIFVCSFNAKTTVVRPQLVYRFMHAFTCIT